MKAGLLVLGALSLVAFGAIARKARTGAIDVKRLDAWATASNRPVFYWPARKQPFTLRELGELNFAQGIELEQLARAVQVVESGDFYVFDLANVTSIGDPLPAVPAPAFRKNYAQFGSPGWVPLP